MNMINNYEEKKYYIPGFNYLTLLFSAFMSSLITLIFTYPFDVAFTRAAVNLNYDKSYQKLSDCFMSNPQQSIVLRYYSGLTLGIAQTLVHSTITLLGYQILNESLYKVDKDNVTYLSVFGKTSLIGLIASIISYPFDTVKRRYQVYSMLDGNANIQMVLKGNYYK
jgi:hypothetical protein